ncbi:hypothetical protein IW261DRAFT_1463117 [Armillaria novae-zelandiae]|uniref:Secreted protein n=1 Tax=Armillaria novae-zelandiae TaxID=153914 RepID=A0AA39PFS2_9AGAR|nr:hypothetical protein IW261DRAFT_1463117 [Armillaria novae-zelandiae]
MFIECRKLTFLLLTVLFTLTRFLVVEQGIVASELWTQPTCCALPVHLYRVGIAHSCRVHPLCQRPRQSMRVHTWSASCTLQSNIKVYFLICYGPYLSQSSVF